jgi:hypothetical protein
MVDTAIRQRVSDMIVSLQADLRQPIIKLYEEHFGERQAHTVLANALLAVDKGCSINPSGVTLDDFAHDVDTRAWLKLLDNDPDRLFQKSIVDEAFRSVKMLLAAREKDAHQKWAHGRKGPKDFEWYTISLAAAGAEVLFALEATGTAQRMLDKRDEWNTSYVQRKSKPAPDPAEQTRIHTPIIEPPSSPTTTQAPVPPITSAPIRAQEQQPDSQTPYRATPARRNQSIGIFTILGAVALILIAGLAMLTVIMGRFPSSLTPPTAPTEALIVTLPFLATQNAQLTAAQIATVAAGLPLSDAQRAELERQIEARGFVTQQELELALTQVGITEGELRNAIGTALPDLSSTLVPEVIAMLDQREQIALQEATATANALVCELTPRFGDGAAIRSFPQDVPGDSANWIAAMPYGATGRATGHNGGDLNTTKWWAINYTDPTGSEYRGWVWSGAVNVSDEVVCARVIRAPGT